MKGRRCVSIKFTIAELNLLYLYYDETRTNTAKKISDAIPYINEPDVLEIANKVFLKLNQMSKAEFKASISLSEQRGTFL